MKLEHREFLKSEEGRKWLIEKTVEVVPKENNWQDFQTPYDLCEKMISKTTLEGKTILVLFNVEFLEVLIYKFGVSSENIMFLADCKIESEIAAKVYKVNNIIVNNIDNIKEVLKEMKTFDLCFSNPPYTNNIDLKIMKEVFKICSEMIVVHPCGWLLQKKDKMKLFVSYKNLLKENIKSIEIFNGNPVFSIDLINPCAIYHIRKNYGQNFEVDYFDHKYIANNIFYVSHHNEYWNIIVTSFINNISEYIKNHKSLNDKYINIKDLIISDNKTYCQFTAMQPGTASNAGNKMYNDDFWIFIRNDKDKYKVVKKNMSEDTLTYEFSNEIERDNFIDYLQTNFARFCLSILKTHQHLKRGEMSFVPWLDFKQNWTDEKLYKLFEISEEISNYISNFFSDNFYRR